MKPTYRPDIDGLRAIAVISVVLFHAGLTSFQGGYIGVDVFFVISGFLITTIIRQETERGEFSLGRFYERRIRRIFPALFVVMASCAVAGSLLLSPADLKSLGKDLAAVSLFASNMLFWYQTGYFDAPADQKPLLHTWSLSVEEQYYILFPLTLLVIGRYLGSRYARWLGLLAVASFAGSIYSVARYPSAGFYFAASRAWELLLGGILSLDVLPLSGRKLGSALSVVGLVLICSGVALYSAETPFPGLAAALPTVGTGLVIYSGLGGPTLAGRLLSIRPLVLVGEMSYSLYLWHWPLFVFARYFAIRELTRLEILAVLTLTVVLSTLSWRFVEQPFRSRKHLLVRSRIFGAGALATVVMTGLGTWLYLADGLPRRFDRSVASDEVVDPEFERWRGCQPQTENSDEWSSACLLGAPGGTPTFLLWGDSHARALATALDVSASKKKVTGSLATSNVCPPLLDVEQSLGQPSCLAFNTRMLRRIENHPELKTIILAGRWALYASGVRYKTEKGSKTKLVDRLSNSSEDLTGPAVLAIGLTRTVRHLSQLNRRVVLVGQIPEVGYHVPSAIVAARRTGRDVNDVIAPTVEEYADRNEGVRFAFRALESEPVEIIELWPTMCDARSCRVVQSGRALYIDSNHLSGYGSANLSPLFDHLFVQPDSKR